MSGKQYDILSRCVEIDDKLQSYKHELGGQELHVDWLKRQIEKLEIERQELMRKLSEMDKRFLKDKKAENKETGK